jgi:membrane glycosyltransferase
MRHVTTFEAAAVSLLRSSSARLEARAQRKAQRRANRAPALAVATVRRVTLMVGALASFTYAAASWHMWAGLVVGGLCALYLEQSFSDD